MKKRIIVCILAVVLLFSAACSESVINVVDSDSFENKNLDEEIASEDLSRKDLQDNRKVQEEGALDKKGALDDGGTFEEEQAINEKDLKDGDTVSDNNNCSERIERHNLKQEKSKRGNVPTTTPKPSSKPVSTPKATSTPKPTPKPTVAPSPKPKSTVKTTATPSPKTTPKATTTPKTTSQPNEGPIEIKIEFLANVEEKIVELCNVERGREGLDPLEHNSTLRKAARLKSEEMGIHNYFEHKSPITGKQGWDIAKDLGYTYGWFGENIWCKWMTSDAPNYWESYREQFISSITAKEIVESWMNSPGHKENILKSEFKNIGVGVAVTTDLRVYATQMFSD